MVILVTSFVDFDLMVRCYTERSRRKYQGLRIFLL